MAGSGSSDDCAPPCEVSNVDVLSRTRKRRPDRPRWPAGRLGGGCAGPRGSGTPSLLQVRGQFSFGLSCAPTQPDAQSEGRQKALLGSQHAPLICGSVGPQLLGSDQAITSVARGWWPCGRTITPVHAGTDERPATTQEEWNVRTPSPQRTGSTSNPSEGEWAHGATRPPRRRRRTSPQEARGSAPR
ncbi:MAG: hypothetical protein QOD49_2845 [Actinomycetota bacterium]|nr:hypothetical protein [Actinomycetota bacterium]